jgi:hypothetical protein
MITAKYLIDNPTHIFVFGDNSLHRGTKGAAALRYHSNSYGFITKKYPSYKDDAYYKPKEYELIFKRELDKLIDIIKHSPNNLFLISMLGAGLANKYHIFEKVIEPQIKDKLDFQNVKFLW